MKRASVLIALVLLVGAASFAPARAADWLSFEPAGEPNATTISVEGKSLTYYRFGAGESLMFSIEGPTRVKVLTRARIPNDMDSMSYSVSIERDGVLERTEEMESSPLDTAYYVALNHFRPGAIRRVYIDVPTGRHGYTLRAGEGATVDARLFRSAASKPPRVSLAPSIYSAVETLLHREKELTYYILTKDDPVRLEVVGPTSVKVNTRLIYDSTMLASQTFVLGIREPGGPEKLYRIDAEPSETVVLRDRRDALPGALRHFMLEVGDGPHTYEFRLVDSVAGELAIKFYIPRGDLTNAP